MTESQMKTVQVIVFLEIKKHDVMIKKYIFFTLEIQFNINYVEKNFKFLKNYRKKKVEKYWFFLN